MIRRTVALYARDERAYLHPMAFSDMGLLIAVKPFEEVRLDSAASKVRELLEIEFSRVPHPKSWDILQPLIEMAGEKNWQDFAKKSRYLTFDLDGELLRVKEGEWDGKGFSSSENEKELPVTCSDAELQLCLEELLQ